jgi:hypothetical protein
MKSRFVPKPLRFEGLTDAQLGALGKQYRYMILRGVIGSVVLTNAVQSAFLWYQDQPHHWIWENQRGHKWDIDTGMVDKKKRRIYIKNWLFRQIDDYIKMSPVVPSIEYGKPVIRPGHPGRVAISKSEPLLRTLIEAIFNVDYRIERIRKKGMTLGEMATAHLKHIVAGVTPLDSFLGQEDEVRDWRESMLVLTGTWVRHGIVDDAVAGDILMDYYDYHARGEHQRSKASKQISKLIQLGKVDEATTKTISAVRQHQLSPKAFKSIMMKLKMPFIYRISMAGKKIRPDFLRFIFTLPEGKRAAYLRRISGAGAKAVLQAPRIPRKPTPLALEREESLGGEWSIMP